MKQAEGLEETVVQVAELERARRALAERGRELECLRAVCAPARGEGGSVEEAQRLVDLIPTAFPDPAVICARATFAEGSLFTTNFREARARLSQSIVVGGEAIGALEVHCLEEATPGGEGYFSEEKRRFLEIVAARLGDIVGDMRERQERDLAREQRLLIERLQQAIRELSVPVLEVWDGVLAAPLIGVLDSMRMADFMGHLLEDVSRKQARFVIIDITGVTVVDTSIANMLFTLSSAVRLLGASCLYTGVHPMVAQTMVDLGFDLPFMKTKRTLRDGLQECLRQMRAAL